MVVIVRNPVYRVLALCVTLAIFLILYFTVIKPDNDTANTQVKAGEQQIQQAVSKVNQQNPGAIPAGVQSLTACITAAGTNTGELQACQVKFKP